MKSNLKIMRMVSLSSVVLVVMFLTACGGGGGGGSSGDGTLLTTGTAPDIDSVYFYNTDLYPDIDVVFTIGEKFNYRVYASDPDLDIITLFITRYLPYDSDMPYDGPTPTPLSTQISEYMTYFTTDPIEVTGPAGNWRIEFQIEDAQGNESNIFEIYITVLE